MVKVGLLLLVLLAAPAAAEQSSLNPITRVVELLEGMVKKITSDGKAEEDLFEKYVCWYKTVVSSKKASNSAAADRIEELSAYIDDVKSGRVEFTSERGDLEADIAKLQEDIESSAAMRKKENEDFLAAKDEMEKAIAALEKAVEVLGTTTADMKTGVLAEMGFDLRHAVNLAKQSQSMSEQDVKFLERVLDGEDVGAPDWKKLNRKAVFKMKYKARSLKIQEILADMLQTFQDNLKDAIKKENDSKATFDKLTEQKNSQLSAAQDALTAGDAEGGARSLSIQESQEEVDSLTAQVKADEEYISQAEESYATMKDEWKERKRLRTEEVASIEKSIAILTSDEARDIMSSSFKSQTAMLLQETGTEQMARVRQAAAKVGQLAVKHQDSRLAALQVSMMFSQKGHFDEVVDGIEKIMHDLHKENDMDLKVKEDCENDRDKNTKMAKNAAYDIDTETALIVRKEAEIEAKNAEIQRLTAEKKELNLQRDEATVNRRNEKLDYEAAKADDEAAHTLIGKAKDVLAKFYQDNGLALAQQASRQPVVTAGAAPPPPPTTWSEPYGGAKGENNGVQSIMQMVMDDVQKDIKTATDAENQAIADFDAFMANTKAQIEKIDSDVTGLEGEIGDAELAIKEARATRGDKKKVMDDTLMYLRSIAEGCDFMAANFELRKSNREAEADGLLEAEAALTGGTFR